MRGFFILNWMDSSAPNRFSLQTSPSKRTGCTALNEAGGRHPPYPRRHRQYPSAAHIPPMCHEYPSGTAHTLPKSSAHQLLSHPQHAAAFVTAGRACRFPNALACYGKCRAQKLVLGLSCMRSCAQSLFLSPAPPYISHIDVIYPQRSLAQLDIYWRRIAALRTMLDYLVGPIFTGSKNKNKERSSMRVMTFEEVNGCAGGMTGQCMAEGGLNYVVTAGAIAVTIGTGGLAGVAALAGAALSWSSWYRDCGPSANYGEK